MHISKDNLAVLSVVLALGATYFLVVYRGQSSALEKVRDRTAQCRRQLEADALQASRVPPMLREMEAMKQRYNTDWDRRLPKRQELAGFLREIASDLTQESLSNTITKPGSPTRGPLYNCLPITMQFEGEFLALAGFLRRVDSMTRLTRLEQLSLEPKDQDGSGNLSIVLGMNIYFTEH